MHTPEAVEASSVNFVFFTFFIYAISTAIALFGRTRDSSDNASIYVWLWFAGSVALFVVAAYVWKRAVCAEKHQFAHWRRHMASSKTRNTTAAARFLALVLLTTVIFIFFALIRVANLWETLIVPINMLPLSAIVVAEASFTYIYQKRRPQPTFVDASTEGAIVVKEH